jgi:murein DD-endopeptidase MepM/ murein hydrolase activator NlpD
LHCENQTPETAEAEEQHKQSSNGALKPVLLGLFTSVLALSSLSFLNQGSNAGTLGIRLPQQSELLALNQSQDESAAEETPAKQITYIVVSGDTLVSVAKRYQTSPYILIESNRLKSKQLKAGQRLIIPGQVATPEDSAEDSKAKAEALLEEAKQRLAAKAQESKPAEETINQQEEVSEATVAQEPQGLGPKALLEEAQQRLAKKQASLLGAENQPFSAQDFQLASAKEDTAFRSGQRFIKPVPGVLFSRFGMRGGRLHAGVDIAGPIGTPVVAAKDGIVVTAGIRLSGYGQMVDIQHADNTLTRYAHASKIFVRVGQRVRQGDVIMARGCSGHCTGPHVHFEVRIGGTPVNPMRFIR